MTDVLHHFAHSSEADAFTYAYFGAFGVLFNAKVGNTFIGDGIEAQAIKDNLSIPLSGGMARRACTSCLSLSMEDDLLPGESLITIGSSPFMLFNRGEWRAGYMGIPSVSNSYGKSLDGNYVIVPVTRQYGDYKRLNAGPLADSDGLLKDGSILPGGSGVSASSSIEYWEIPYIGDLAATTGKPLRAEILASLQVMVGVSGAILGFKYKESLLTKGVDDEPNLPLRREWEVSAADVCETLPRRVNRLDPYLKELTHGFINPQTGESYIACESVTYKGNGLSVVTVAPDGTWKRDDSFSTSDGTKDNRYSTRSKASGNKTYTGDYNAWSTTEDHSSDFSYNTNLTVTENHHLSGPLIRYVDSSGAVKDVTLTVSSRKLEDFTGQSVSKNKHHSEASGGQGHTSSSSAESNGSINSSNNYVVNNRKETSIALWDGASVSVVDSSNISCNSYSNLTRTFSYSSGGGSSGANGFHSEQGYVWSQTSVYHTIQNVFIDPLAKVCVMYVQKVETSYFCSWSNSHTDSSTPNHNPYSNLAGTTKITTTRYIEVCHGSVKKQYPLYSDIYSTDQASSHHMFGLYTALRVEWEGYDVPFMTNLDGTPYMGGLLDPYTIYGQSGEYVHDTPEYSVGGSYPVVYRDTTVIPPLFSNLGPLWWDPKEEWSGFWGPRDSQEFHCVHWGDRSFLSLVIRPKDSPNGGSEGSWKRHTSIYPPELQSQVEGELGVSLSSLTEVEYVIPVGSSNPAPSS